MILKIIAQIIIYTLKIESSGSLKKKVTLGPYPRLIESESLKAPRKIQFESFSRDSKWQLG